MSTTHSALTITDTLTGDTETIRFENDLTVDSEHTATQVRFATIKAARLVEDFLMSGGMATAEGREIKGRFDEQARCIAIMTGHSTDTVEREITALAAKTMGARNETMVNLTGRV